MNSRPTQLAPHRAGSILILVVALLVLLALIGTAWISTARTDLYAARQHTYNTQIELLVQSATNLVNASITSDLYKDGQFRPPTEDPVTYWPNDPKLTPPRSNADLPSGYEPSDSPWRDGHLADRIPVFENNNVGPMWRHISGSPLGSGGFETPFATQGNLAPLGAGGFRGPYAHSQRIDLLPRFLTLPSGKSYPALQQVLGEYGGPNPSRDNIYLAGDADGDGIPDSALWPLPIGPINGVKYYVSYRVIDNNSAVNAAVAWRPEVAGEAQGNLDGQFFPTNINLAQMLPAGNADIRRLNAYRFNNEQAFVNRDRVWMDNDWQLKNPNKSDRDDMRFLSVFDAVWHQLGARLANPGWNALGGNNRVLFQALPFSDSAALARNFIIADPNGSPSITESALRVHTWFDSSVPAQQKPFVPTEPYVANDQSVGDWFRDNFFFPTFGNAPNRSMHQRSVLTTWNPVSNYAPSKFINRGRYVLQAPYFVGDVVTVDPNGNPPAGIPNDPAWPRGPKAFVAISRQGPGFGNIQPDYWQPWRSAAAWAPLDSVNHPVKVSVNTGTYGQLFSAFWSVMVERDPASGVPTIPFLAHLDTQARELKTGSGAEAYSPIRARMFRTPIRDPRNVDPLKSPENAASKFPWLTPYQTLQLRAALAAVNTLDLRDADDNVTSRTVVLSDPNPAFANHPVYYAKVYGSEMQPYLTEVYANNNVALGDDGFVAIELYNPFNVPLVLRNWRLGMLAGRGTNTPMTLVPIDTHASTSGAMHGTNGAYTAENWSVAAGIPTIPPGGYIVISNAAAPAGIAPNVGWYVVPDLRRIYGNELVLLRPRRFDGALVSNLNDTTAPNADRFDETTASLGKTTDNLRDLIPVDSFDFANLPAPIGAVDPVAWHYTRPSGPAAIGAGKAWHWVWPGKFNQAIATEPHAGPTDVETPAPAVLNPADPKIASLGTGEAMPAVTAGVKAYISVPLQIAGADTPGPNKTRTTADNTFPFGGFAREGDILHVPFIGAYRIQTYDQYSAAATVNATVTELNSVSMDSAMADDMDDDDNLDNLGNAVEQIGRFCPINYEDLVQPGQPLPANIYFDDYQRTASPPWDPGSIRYGWAMDLFDYVTVNSPQRDYLPNVDPGFREPTGDAASNFVYPPGKEDPRPQGVANENPARHNNLDGSTEEATGVQGLININTAPTWVLQQVPMYENTGVANPLASNMALARQITYWRDGQCYPTGANFPRVAPHRPIRSLFELNLIPQVREAQRAIIAASGGNGLKEGDISQDSVLSDFESRYLMMTRLSNFLTTRSDTFTVYLQVQGWRDVGGENPELVVQRRVAYIADRTGVSPNSPNMTITNIPVGN